MIKSILILLLTFFHAKPFAQNVITLKGNISEKYNGCEAHLVSRNQKIVPVKTTIIKGKFHLSANLINEYEMLYLSIQRAGSTLGSIHFFSASGNFKVVVKTDSGLIKANEISISNTSFQVEKSAYELLCKNAADTLSVLFNKINRTKQQQPASSNQDSLVQLYRIKQKYFFEQKLVYFRSYPKSYSSLFYFNDEIKNYIGLSQYPIDSLLEVYNRFDEQLRNTSLGKETGKYLNTRNALALQAVLPDFSIRTIDNKLFQLSDYRNRKYVLLCFWDSWCTPCIKSFPLLRTIDSTYSQQGLEMISISIDSDKQKWLNSLERYKLSWLQACDLAPYVSKDQILRSLYDISYMPQYFLVDKEGRLIYHNVQSKDNDNYEVLQKLLRERLQ